MGTDGGNSIDVNLDFSEKLDLLKPHFNVATRAQVIEALALLDYSHYESESWHGFEDDVFAVTAEVSFDHELAEKLDELKAVFGASTHGEVVKCMMHAFLLPLYEQSNRPSLP